MITIISNNGTEYFLPDSKTYEKWPRINNLVKQTGPEDEKKYYVYDIDNRSIELTLEFLNLYKEPENYFGIHAPLKYNKSLDIVKEKPDDPDEGGFATLNVSGVPDIFIRYLDNLSVEDVGNLLYFSYSENITMLSELLSAYFAQCLCKYQWKKIHYYMLKVKRVNRFILHESKNFYEKEYINQIISSRVGIKEFIYEDSRPPLNLEAEKLKIPEIPFCSHCEILHDFKELKILEDSNTIKPLSEEEKEAKRYRGLKYSEYFDLSDIPNIDKYNPNEIPEKRSDATNKLIQKEIIEEQILKPYHEDKYGDSDDDDVDSYTDIFDDPECPPYDPVIEAEFMLKKSIRQGIRRKTIDARKQNRTDLKQFTYRYMREVENYDYFNEREFLIIINIIENPMYYCLKSVKIDKRKYDVEKEKTDDNKEDKKKLEITDVDGVSESKEDTTETEMTDGADGDGVSESKDDTTENEMTDGATESKDDTTLSLVVKDTNTDKIISEEDNFININTINDFKQFLFKYISPDVYDPTEDGYADEVIDQKYLPDEVFPISIDESLPSGPSGPSGPPGHVLTSSILETSY